MVDWISAKQFHDEPGTAGWHVLCGSARSVRRVAGALTSTWPSRMIGPRRESPPFRLRTPDSHVSERWTMASPDNHGVDIAAWGDLDDDA